MLRDVHVVLVLTLIGAPCWATARDIVVGGPVGWGLGVVYNQVNATIGDVLVFKYDRNQHDVVALRNPTCDFTNSTTLLSINEAGGRVPLNATGSNYFACSVQGHCEAGMLLHVLVSEPSSDMSASARSTTRQAGHIRTAEAIGEGNCSAPMPVPGTMDMYSTRCVSVGWAMKPGDVINSFYSLPMPYPEGVLIAVVNQSVQLVDETMRPVPLSEIYVHHVFGDSRNVLGEGAEIRGSMLKRALPEPYAVVFNSSAIRSQQQRMANIHLINTQGVLPTHLYPCVECWCSVMYNSSGKSYLGGTGCCSPANCPTNAPPVPKVYHLDYNTTYRVLEPNDVNVSTKATLYALDLVNGTIEYDLIRRPGVSFDVRETVGSFDERCPQTSNFSIIRCTGHQHIGGACIRLLDESTGQLICESCPTYGTSSSVDDVGNERGYVVEMKDDTLAEPYVLAPGQKVRLVSVYDAAQDHYGLMALMFTYNVDWDPMCPGLPAPEQNFGPPVFQSLGTFFGLITPPSFY